PVLTLRPLIERQPSPPFLLAVLIVAWFAGFGPSVVACALSVAVFAYFFGPGFDVYQLVPLSMLTVVALLMAWLAVVRRQSLAEAQARRD
ncbi:DUF4118 domain-containing protein, partial [Klebsiella pneumoniae]